MAVIRATCSACGDIDLRPKAVSARVCTDDGRAEFSFACPTCQMVSVKPSDLPTVGILADAGVRVEEWSLPAEMEERHNGPPISHDDLIDFHSSISDETRLAAAMQDLVEGFESSAD